jgi:predicted nuclease with TOPRIM domain
MALGENKVKVLTRVQLLQEIEKLSDLMETYETEYPFVEADAEATGDYAEIQALDKAYGKTEDKLQEYRDNLADIESGRMVEPVDISDLAKIFDMFDDLPTDGDDFHGRITGLTS